MTEIANANDYAVYVDESLQGAPTARVDAVDLREQLSGLVKAVGPLMEGKTPGELALDSLELGLTLSAEGKVSFIAKAGLEASITLTFKRTPHQV